MLSTGGGVGGVSADREARAALSAVVEPGEERVAVRVAKTGAEATWAAIRSGDDDLDRSGLLRLRADRVDGAAVLERVDRLGIRYLCPGELGWPALLDAMAATMGSEGGRVPPPLGLYVRGEADLADAVEQSVAMVGSRESTRYGERVASDLAAGLALAGQTVVSGARFGIDAFALRGALAVGGTTVAVLACGVDVPNPRGHSELLEQIAAGGAVVSEVPPGQRPDPTWLRACNRVIAALTAATLIVEASSRSGALSTVTWAHRLGRAVLAVPGPVTSRLSIGCHNLIRTARATLVSETDDVLAAVTNLQRQPIKAARQDHRPAHQQTSAIRTNPR